MAEIVTPYSVTLGATDYPAKYAGLLAYLEQYLNRLELLPPGSRNKIINGDMTIAQRGTSFPAAGAATYSLDRWLFSNVSSAVVTISQQADAPADNEFQNSLRLAITTADASIAAGDGMAIQQRIEGYNARDLIGRTFSLSFRVRSSKTGTHCVSFVNAGDNRSYVAEYTVSAANTWESKTITVTGGLITAGTWDWTTGVGLNVRFALAAGTTFQTTAGAWQTGNFVGTANQVNCLDTIGNIFAITGVQLEVGGVATPFEHRPYGAELALCQRYYQSLPNFAFVTTSDPANVNARTLLAPMRATPTMTGTPASGTGATISVLAGGFSLGIGGYAQSGLHSASVSVTGVSASAEL